MTALLLPTDVEVQPRLANFGPNWFATVMGTGIVANALVTLPHRPPSYAVMALLVWLLTLGLFLTVSAATVLHWARHHSNARAHLSNLAMAPFYGAPAMALTTVGAGFVLCASPYIGTPLAVVVDSVFWATGAALGLVAATVVPYKHFTTHANTKPNASWLMPVVPPMVSASGGGVLLSHTGPGELHTDLLYACWALFGMATFASVLVMSTLWKRLTEHGIGPSRLVPTWWIVLGPLGQSMTVLHLLNASPALAAALLGIALLWAIIALAFTARTIRGGMPFSLTWWSFTFPVGTVVTGTSGLAVGTGSLTLGWLAVAFYIALCAAWSVVGARTAQGVRAHTLFSPLHVEP